MGIILAIATYLVCLIFIGRFVLHFLSWINAVRQPITGMAAIKISPGLAAEMILDVIFFKRLFDTNKLLWVASWTFHVSLFLVILRHVRYFVYPVPGFIMSIQTSGVIAGYILPLSLLMILVIRAAGNHDRYITVYNVFLLSTLLGAGVTGLLLKLFYRVSLVDAKVFSMGIAAFDPGTVPDSALFIVHFILVLILIPFLPFHLIAAPLIAMEARRRDEGLDMVLHEK